MAFKIHKQIGNIRRLPNPISVLIGETQTVSGRRKFAVRIFKQSKNDYAIITNIGTGFTVVFRKTKAKAEEYAQKEYRFMKEEF
jgi:hypothetical protein